MVVFGVIIIILGGMAFMIGWTILNKRRDWMKNTARVLGLVEEDRIVYEVDGKSYALRVTSTNIKGRSLPIRYSLQNPGQARVDAPLATWLAPAFFMLLGSGLLLTGIGMVKG
ncbi:MULTISPECIES: DUF3592 domain-containing protein [unclassified Siphonobacter]|uniref:DUF3592 domain-containing protein n=1 Tax=unclassified Siphonobacter TaxID=2635712 RepID=UPI000CAD4842|nr:MULTISPECIES: DUF3592 domain-containing protein [unclassified Siphonobacter]MDQ1088323.1 hypothetical protein [Siphonobacter sp. SORGH_AS_1065]MDR6194464.1 hypothetical protein [Siphonobacter sp. SORGH_AS_0500]PKK37758.1 hypothetical protein BWI96_04630 [Siphonobacter sp. SORGH_AS_0500]